MPSHTAKVEAVTTAKIVAPTEVEALRVATNLHQLVEDPETTSNAVKGELLNHERRLQMYAGNAQAREEIMRQAVSAAARA